MSKIWQFFTKHPYTTFFTFLGIVTAAFFAPALVPMIAGLIALIPITIAATTIQALAISAFVVSTALIAGVFAWGMTTLSSWLKAANTVAPLNTPSTPATPVPAPEKQTSEIITFQSAQAFAEMLLPSQPDAQQRFFTMIFMENNGKFKPTQKQPIQYQRLWQDIRRCGSINGKSVRGETAIKGSGLTAQSLCEYIFMKVGQIDEEHVLHLAQNWDQHLIGGFIVSPLIFFNNTTDSQANQPIIHYKAGCKLNADFVMVDEKLNMNISFDLIKYPNLQSFKCCDKTNPETSTFERISSAVKYTLVLEIENANPYIYLQSLEIDKEALMHIQHSLIFVMRSERLLAPDAAAQNNHTPHLQR